MSLSERLKAAEAVRRSASAPPLAEQAVVDLRAPSAPTIDLTGNDPDWVFADPAPAADGGIAYDPTRKGDASLAFGDGDSLLADRRSAQPCPRCGGPTQVDLYDQVHQMVSLSCTTCFHMFRQPA